MREAFRKSDHPINIFLPSKDDVLSKSSIYGKCIDVLGSQAFCATKASSVSNTMWECCSHMSLGHHNCVKNQLVIIEEKNMLARLSKVVISLVLLVVLVMTVAPQEARAISVEGYVMNETDLVLNFSSENNPRWGGKAKIKTDTLSPNSGNYGDIFHADSDGAGVQGHVYASAIDSKGNQLNWTLSYDVPVIGGNACDITDKSGYVADCSVSAGNDPNMNYNIRKIKT
ncbi:MAG: hypothetical protein F6K19_45555 [Cyanothece sp. SIO1E1]|nr:hypothetical protein [Cyanothece sp. SIO1E1]